MLRPVNWASEMFDGAITWIVAHVPGWTVALLALFFYPVLGLIVPLWLRWPVIWLVDANVIGTALAASFGLGWLGAVVEQARRRHLVDWTSSLRNLDWQEFEWAVGEM